MSIICIQYNIPHPYLQPYFVYSLANVLSSHQGWSALPLACAIFYQIDKKARQTKRRCNLILILLKNLPNIKGVFPFSSLSQIVIFFIPSNSIIFFKTSTFPALFYKNYGNIKIIDILNKKYRTAKFKKERFLFLHIQTHSI